MATRGSDFKQEFDRLAVDGFIGDPTGRLAYGYIRVSSDGQADEGASGLPRQIAHIAEIAQERGYKIPWDFVYADDCSGFTFEDRPALSELRREYRRKRADAIVIEHLDRLSRESSWHQGFLLDEMQRAGIAPIFWKTFGSRIERAVLGAVAQDAMEQAIGRMVEGTRRKARSGRITAKRAALGYKLVGDSRMTYYEIDDNRAPCIELIYQRIAFDGYSVYQLILELDENAKTDPRFAPPSAKSWNERSLVKLIRNPVYRGEYIAGRYFKVKETLTDEHGQQTTVLKERQRPEDEWIRVEVPAIVSPETWELANKNLYRNKGFSRRNKKHQYLLTAMIRCADCGHAFHGQTDRHGTQRYADSVMMYPPAYRENHPCDQKKRTLHCGDLDDAVWEILCHELLDPELIGRAIEAHYDNDHIRSARDQLAFLHGLLRGKDGEEEKLRRAYLAEAFDEHEFAAERKRVAGERQIIVAQIEVLKTQVLSPEELAAKKQQTVHLLEAARKLVEVADAPFELKQKIVRLLIDEITLDLDGGRFEIKGLIGAGIYGLGCENVKPQTFSQLRYSILCCLLTQAVTSTKVEFA